MNPAGDTKKVAQRLSSCAGSLFSHKTGAVAHFADIISETSDANVKILKMPQLVNAMLASDKILDSCKSVAKSITNDHEKAPIEGLEEVNQIVKSAEAFTLTKDWPQARNHGKCSGLATNCSEALINPEQEMKMYTLPMARNQQPILSKGIEVPKDPNPESNDQPVATVQRENLGRDETEEDTNEMEIIAEGNTKKNAQMPSRCFGSLFASKFGAVAHFADIISETSDVNGSRFTSMEKESVAEWNGHDENQVEELAKLSQLVKKIEAFILENDSENTSNPEQSPGSATNNDEAQSDLVQDTEVNMQPIATDQQPIHRKRTEVSEKPTPEANVQPKRNVQRENSNDESSAEIENLRKKVQQLEENLSEFQRQFVNNQTSRNSSLEASRPELEQNRGAPSITVTSLQAMPDPNNHFALTDCQPTLSPVFNHQSRISEESTNEKEVALNYDLSHLISTNTYPGTVSSATMDNRCEINTTDHYHEGSEEIQVSDVDHAIMSTDKASDNGNTRLSKQNEVHSAVDTNNITTDISPSIPAEIPALKRAKVPNKQIGSRASKPPREHLLDDEKPLRFRLRDRNQIHYYPTVEIKRSCISRTEQNLPQCSEDNSLATSMVEVLDQQQHGFEENLDECEMEDDVSETLASKTRAHDSNKESHCESKESNFQGNFQPKVRPQFKKKCKISHIRDNVDPKRAVNGEMHHKCKHCHYATNNKTCFTRHVRTHTGEKPFKCRICKYTAAQRGNLIRHIRSHTGEKPYKCRFCEFATAQNNHLTEHSRIHTGEKPFKCRFCKYATAKSSHLIRHNRIHTGDKPYKCRFCKYATADRGNFIKHNRIHTGEKPFKCRFCKYTTAQSSDLIKHNRIHTGDKPYKCRFCQFASSCNSNLSLHMRRKHKDALKVHEANSNKNAKRNLRKKSGKKD